MYGLWGHILVLTCISVTLASGLALLYHGSSYWTNTGLMEGLDDEIFERVPRSRGWHIGSMRQILAIII